jgi:hypothetical protein
MNIEKIQEPISVLAACSGGSLEPLRLRWGGRTYKVQAVNARWVDRQGDIYSLCYSLQCDGQTPMVVTSMAAAMSPIIMGLLACTCFSWQNAVGSRE